MSLHRKNILLLILLFSTYSNFLYGQKDTSLKYQFSFYKYNNQKKIKKLRYGDEIKVTLCSMPFIGDKHLIKNFYGDYVKPDSTSIDITYTGILNTKTDSILSINLNEKNIETSEYCVDTDSQYKYNKIYYKKGEPMGDSISGANNNICKRDTAITIIDNCPVYYNVGRTSSTNINYYGDSTLNINLRKIDYVTFNRPGNFTDNTFNGVLLCLSFASALIIAPAASINYSNGEFNAHRYYSVMIPSLALFSCDLTLYLAMNRERKYKVKVGLR